MKASTYLIKAQSLIKNPENLCTGFYKDKSGTKYCAAGALLHFYNDQETAYYRSYIYLNIAADVWLKLGHYNNRHFMPVPYINDVFGHEAIMEMFAIAIEMALEEEMKEEKKPVLEREVVNV